MANTIGSREVIELQGWKEPIEIHPLTIKAMRGLFKIFEKIETGDEDTVMLDVMVEACAHCMKTFEPELSGKDDEDCWLIEEYADMPTIEKILEVAGGVKLNDPNLIAAYQAANGTKA